MISFASSGHMNDAATHLPHVRETTEMSCKSTPAMYVPAACVLHAQVCLLCMCKQWHQLCRPVCCWTACQLFAKHSRHLCRITNDEGKKLTCVSNFDTDYRIQELAANDEVFVSYAQRGGQFESTPLQMLIDYGFVPDELLEGGIMPAGDDEDFDM